MEVDAVSEIEDFVEEEEVVETIQGNYEDEFSENIEENSISQELAQEENNVIVKIFIVIILIVIFMFGIFRKKIKR